MNSINLMRGRIFVRAAILNARGLVHDPEQTLSAAISLWGAGQAEQIAKAAAPALTTTDTGTEVAREFLQIVRERSLIGRLVGLRKPPFNVRGLKFVEGAKGYWVAEGKAVPMSKQTMEGTILRPLRVSGLVATTKEMVAAQGDAAENAVQTDLENGVTGVLDLTFLDPSNAGVADEIPAAITYGAPSVTSTGNLHNDIAALVDAFGGDLGAAYFVTDPTTATKIAMATDAGGRYLFPEAGPRGGAILGIPLLTTRQSPVTSNGGQLALIDPTGIDATVDNLRLVSSNQASVQMLDNPTNDSVTPTATTVVSLWQTNSVGFMANLDANWQVQRPGSVVVLEGL